MEKLGEYAEEESPNTEIRQMSREPVIEEVTAHSSELMQTINNLKTEIESVKKDNERILKTQEELNQILMEKFQTEGRSKRSESEEASHQKGSKKMKLAKPDSSSSSEESKEQQKVIANLSTLLIFCPFFIRVNLYDIPCVQYFLVETEKNITTTLVYPNLYDLRI